MSTPSPTASPSVTSGKVVLIPFPFDDLSGAKVRPAVCLTEPIGPHHHIVVAFITSRVQPSSLETDISLRPEDPDFGQTGLRVPSTICLHRLMTIAASSVLRELGTLSDSRLAVVRQRLRLLFQLG
jgi:mRNA interferase MazF